MSSDSPAAILFNELGQPVGVIFDGTIYRLQTQDIIVDGYGNGPVAVTPPFTAALPEDPALVVAISPNNSFVINFQKPSTSNTSSVASSASNVVLLPSNTLRLGATVFNDSTAILYIKLGATATTSDFTTKMLPGTYYEIPFGYLGEIDGIWANGTGISGFARLDELSP